VSDASIDWKNRTELNGLEHGRNRGHAQVLGCRRDRTRKLYVGPGEVPRWADPYAHPAGSQVYVRQTGGGRQFGDAADECRTRGHRRRVEPGARADV
jgi:hypothetical protein